MEGRISRTRRDDNLAVLDDKGGVPIERSGVPIKKDPRCIAASPEGGGFENESDPSLRQGPRYASRTTIGRAF